MKIALLTPGFSPNAEDWGIPVLRNLVREFSRRHEVHVFTLRYPLRTEPYQVFGAAVHPFGGAANGGLRRIPFLYRALAAIREAGPFDVIHALWADEPGFLAALAGRLFNTPSVVTIMGGELVGLREISYGGQLSRINRVLINYGLAHAGHVTGGSGFLSKFASAPRISVIPLGVDVALFSPGPGPGAPPFDRNRFNLLHVASLSPVKDQRTLLAAFAAVVRERPDMHLNIAGDGPLRGELEHLAADLGCVASVTFHGAVSHEALPGYYRSADLFVLCSLFESQSLVVLEAAACGVTSVGTAVGLLPELLPPSHLAETGDVDGLAGAIARLAGDAGQRDIASLAVSRLVRQDYTLDRTVERFLSLYESLSP